MALNILPQMNFGGELASAGSTGLQQGLQRLLDAQEKEKLLQLQMQAKQQQSLQQNLAKSLYNSQQQGQQAQALSNLFNLDPNAALQLTQSSPQLQKEVFARLNWDELFKNQADNIPTSSGATPQENLLTGLIATKKIQGLPSSLPLMTEETETIEEIQPVKRGLGDIITSEKPLDRATEEKLKQRERLHEDAALRKEIDRSRDRHKDYIQKTLSKKSTERETLDVLDKMISLDPNLDSPAKTAFKGWLGQKFGIGDLALLTPESQQFKKLENFFLKNLKTIFGSRPTQLEVQQYLKSIPTLWNTSEGRARIIRDLRNAAIAEGLEAETLNEIIQEYNQTQKPYPDNLKFIVEERLKPKLEQLRSTTTNLKPKRFKNPRTGKIEMIYEYN